MLLHLACPQNHHWQLDVDGNALTTDLPMACPVCGAAAAEIASAPGAQGAAPAVRTAAAPTVLESLPSTAMEIAPEQAAVLGYEILGELGRGGMGVVYKGRDQSLNRLVALKMILAGGLADERATARFRTEAEAIARLQHPHIVQIHKVGANRGCPYLVLEFVAGGSLAARLDGTPWTARAAAQLVETLARAVHCAHQAGVVHRDLKPANVLLTPEGTPKITDFGLAKLVDAEPGPTQSGTLLGTPSYMAPEQAAGKADAMGPATDVYALGAILYELLTGRPPFLADTPLATALQVLHNEPAAPRLLQAQVPRDLETVCLQCLQKDPARRYPSALALAEDLGRFLRGDVVQARPAPAWERVVYRLKRHPTATALAFVLLVLVCLLGWEFGPLAYRYATNQGTLFLDTDVPGAAVIVKQQGKEVAVVEADAAPEVMLPAGTYRLELPPSARGVILSTPEVTLRRGGRKAVEIRLRAPGTGPPPRLQITSAVREFKGHTGPVRSVAFSSDSRFALSGSGWPKGDRTMRLWDVATGQPLRRFEGHQGDVLAVAFDPQGRWALSGSADRTVRLWEVATGKEVLSFEGHKGEVECVAFAPQGGLVLSGSKDRSIRLWDVATGKEVRQFTGHKAGVAAVAFSPDGRRAVSSSAQGNAVRLWDVASGKELQRFEGHTVLGVYGVAFSPDGKRVVSGGADRVVRVWDAANGQELRHFDGHTGVVSSVAFAPDGHRVVSGSWDRTVRLWDVVNGRELARFLGHKEEVWSVAVSPDGRYLLSGGGGDLHNDGYGPGRDWALRLWTLP